MVRKASRQGLVWSLIALVLVLAIAGMSFVIMYVDPLQTITRDLDRLYANEVASGSSAADTSWLIVWVLVCLAFTGFIVALGLHEPKTGLTPAHLVWRTVNLAALGLCVIVLTSAVPAFFIGVSLVVEAENGGFYAGTLGPSSTLLSLQGLAVVVMVALVGSAIVERLGRSRRLIGQRRNIQAY